MLSGHDHISVSVVPKKTRSMFPARARSMNLSWCPPSSAVNGPAGAPDIGVQIAWGGATRGVCVTSGSGCCAQAAQHNVRPRSVAAVTALQRLGKRPPTIAFVDIAIILVIGPPGLNFVIVPL